MADVKPTPPGSSFAYRTGVDALREQLQRIDALDSKAGVTLAAAGVFAGFIFRNDSVLSRAPRPIGVTGACLLIVAMLTALLSFATRGYRSAPTPEAVVRLMAFPDEWLRWRLLGNVLDALAVNRTKLESKARLLTFAQSSLLAVVGTIGGYLIYALSHGWRGGA